MKKFLLALTLPVLLAACGDKPADPVTPEPEVTAAPMESTNAVPNELSQVGVATDDTATATAQDPADTMVGVAE